MAEPLDRNEALAAFERFKEAVAKIAGVPKALAKKTQPKRRARKVTAR